MDIKPRHWKYDAELGIVFYCPVCRRVVYIDKCECGQRLDTKNEIHDESKKVRW